MPALPANVVRARRRARLVTLTDAGVQGDYPGARDALDDPDPGYFEDASDAASALALKAALVAAPRKRFAVALAEEIAFDPLTGIPTMQLVDSELGFDGPVLPTRIEVNLEDETSTVEVMG